MLDNAPQFVLLLLIESVRSVPACFSAYFMRPQMMQPAASVGDTEVLVAAAAAA